MIADSGRGKRMERSVRMGRWKEAVSSVQRARKKMYCSKIGWEAKRLDDWTSVLMAKSEAFQLEDPLVPFGLGGNGGGGEVGRGVDDGVAFSIRAQVR